MQWTIELFISGAGNKERRIIVASETDRARWEAEILACLPDEPVALAAVARAGISIALEQPPPPPKHVRSQYGAYSAAKLSRIAQRLVSDPATLAAVRERAEQYSRDAAADAAAISAQRVLIESRLPAAPPNYQWVEDSGGPRWEGSPASFRLWSRSLGYMPRSE